MEHWKIERFCETASYQQLLDVENTLKGDISLGLLETTNAKYGLRQVQEAIRLRQAFGEDRLTTAVVVTSFTSVQR